MTNYPEDFKGTNMDAASTIEQEAAEDDLACIIRVLDEQHQVTKMLHLLRESNTLHLTKEEVDHAVRAVGDLLMDLLYDDWKRLQAVAGSIDLPSRVPSPEVACKYRQVPTNPATYKAKGDPL